jgi:hypothetical protein
MTKPNWYRTTAFFELIKVYNTQSVSTNPVQAQLFKANAIERLSRKKPVVVNLGWFLQRLPILLMPPIRLRAVLA